MSETNINLTNLCNKGQDAIQSLLESTVELMQECKNMQISEKSEEKFKLKIDQVIKNKNLLIKIIKEVENNRPQHMSFSNLSIEDSVCSLSESPRIIEHQKLLEIKTNRLKELRNDLRDLQYLLNCGADVNTYVNSKDPTHYVL